MYSVLDSTDVAVGKQGVTWMPSVGRGGDYRQALLDALAARDYAG